VSDAADVRAGRAAPPAGGLVGRHVVVDGVVQGVGFRPFVYRLATELGLTGTVRNVAGRVEIDIAGPASALEAFTRRLRTDAPPRATVERVLADPVSRATVRPHEPGGFAIDASAAGAAPERLFPPDLATCDACLDEVRDPADRRYRYPFTNCTDCGPRATIIEDLPYDRAATTMRTFAMCPACAAEYADPVDRRFHAEPVA
jgi:hydrogenase maturation protein HypF